MTFTFESGRRQATAGPRFAGGVIWPLWEKIVARRYDFRPRLNDQCSSRVPQGPSRSNGVIEKKGTRDG